MGNAVQTTGGQAQNGGSMPSPIADVHWTCVCGAKVKGRLDMSKAGVTIRCPNSPCKVTRSLLGQIEHLSVETERGVWRRVDLDRLIHPVDWRLMVSVV
jgi:hypothetical protein